MGSLTSKTATQVVAGKDLSNKVAIVTGPTTGIGYEIAVELASIGCHVILAGRKQARLEKIASDMTTRILKTQPNAKPQFTSIELDLMSFVSIHTFFTKFMALGIPCHYLFNNAGIAAPAYGHTTDGFEKQMGTNCIGHQYLTNLLLPTLISSSTSTNPSRVINTTSAAHWYSTYNVDGGEEECKQKLYPTEKQYGGMSFYGHSKLGNIWHSRELTRRYASQGVISLSCHPGGVSTEIAQQSWSADLLWFVIGWALKNANQGAAPELWAALDTEWPQHVNDSNFSFYSQNECISSSSKKSHDTTFAKIWYDFNDHEIARVASQLGLPIGLTSTSSSPDTTTTPSTSHDEHKQATTTTSTDS